MRRRDLCLALFGVAAAVTPAFAQERERRCEGLLEHERALQAEIGHAKGHDRDVQEADLKATQQNIQEGRCDEGGREEERR